MATWQDRWAVLGVLFCAACSDDSKRSEQTSSLECPVVVSEADCDESLLPIVFVHGTFAAGDTFSHVASLLGSNGFCQANIVGAEYNSLGEQPGVDCDPAAPALGCGKIDAVVDDVLAKTGASQVILSGHSQGTAHCGTYLQAHADKVAHYLNFSGSPDVGSVDTLSISSEHDLGFVPHHATGTSVKQVTFTDEDHFAVADSYRTFVEVYKYIKGGEEPAYTTVQCGDAKVQVEGIAETFADNAPVTGKIEVRKVETPQGAGQPILTITGDATGHFGPVELERGVAYEFKGFDSAGALVGYQYFSPFHRDNRLIRMLTPAASAAIRDLTTNKLNKSPDDMNLVLRWASGGFRKELGASLLVDGKEVLTDENAGTASQSIQALQGGVAAIFACDYDLDGQSDFGLPFTAPFIAFTDFHVPTTPAKLIKVEFTAGSEEPGFEETVTISNFGGDHGPALVFIQ